MSFELRHVQPQQLHDWWEQVTPGLDICRVQDVDTVWLEDIYSCIRAGQASLHVGLVDGRYGGFVVLTTKQDAFNGDQSLHVWFCYNESGFDILSKGQMELEVMARRMNATKITLRANRMCFERLMRGLGYSLAEIELAKEIT